MAQQYARKGKLEESFDEKFSDLSSNSQTCSDASSISTGGSDSDEDKSHDCFSESDYHESFEFDDQFCQSNNRKQQDLLSSCRSWGACCLKLKRPKDPSQLEGRTDQEKCEGDEEGISYDGEIDDSCSESARREASSINSVGPKGKYKLNFRSKVSCNKLPWVKGKYATTPSTPPDKKREEIDRVSSPPEITVKKAKEKTLIEKLKSYGGSRSSVIEKSYHTSLIGSSISKVPSDIEEDSGIAFLQTCQIWFSQLRLDLCVEIIVPVMQMILSFVGTICWKALFEFGYFLFDVISSRFLSIGINVPVEASHLQMICAGIKWIYDLTHDCVAITAKYVGRTAIVSTYIFYRIFVSLMALVFEIVSKMIIVPMVHIVILFFDIDCFLEVSLKSFVVYFISLCSDAMFQQSGKLYRLCLRATYIEYACFQIRLKILEILCYVLTLKRFVSKIPRMIPVIIDVINDTKLYVAIISDTIYVIYIVVWSMANAYYYFYLYLQIFIESLHYFAYFSKQIHNCFYKGFTPR